MIVLDRAHFDHMTGDDRALQREVSELFRMQANAWRSALTGADWRAAAHTLKGSARGIGLHVLAAACEAAECAPEPTGALASVQAALDEALAALAQFDADAA